MVNTTDAKTGRTKLFKAKWAVMKSSSLSLASSLLTSSSQPKKNQNNQYHYCVERLSLALSKDIILVTFMVQVMTFSIGVIESDIVSSSRYKRYYCDVWHHHHHDYHHHHRPIIVKVTFYMFLWQVTFVPKLPNWKMETIYTFKMARSLKL